jgi:hypothetical protein
VSADAVDGDEDDEKEGEFFLFTSSVWSKNLLEEMSR